MLNCVIGLHKFDFFKRGGGLTNAVETRLATTSVSSGDGLMVTCPNTGGMRTMSPFVVLTSAM